MGVEGVGAAAVGYVVAEWGVEGGVVLESAVAEGELTGGPVGGGVVDDRAAEEDAAADGQGRSGGDGRGSGAPHRPARPAEGLAGGDVDGAGAVEGAAGEKPVDVIGVGVQRQGAVGEGHRPGDAQVTVAATVVVAPETRKVPAPLTVPEEMSKVPPLRSRVVPDGTEIVPVLEPPALIRSVPVLALTVPALVKGMPTARMPEAVSRVKVLEALLLKALVPPPLVMLLLSGALKEALFWKVPLLKAN